MNNKEKTIWVNIHTSEQVTIEEVDSVEDYSGATVYVLSDGSRWEATEFRVHLRERKGEMT